MSRAHPHGFPKDTPQPLAQPYSAACALIDRVFRWSVRTVVLVLRAALCALAAWLNNLPA